MEEDQVELIDYLNVIWKRRVLILLPTVVLTAAVGVGSFLLPRKWEVTSIIQPSKYSMVTSQGQFEEIVVTPPQQIASQINEESYNGLIAAELNLNLNSFPKLTAENVRNTQLVKVSVRHKDIAIAKQISYSLFGHLKSDLDKKIDIELLNMDADIKQNEIERDLRNKEIVILENKSKIMDQREQELIQEMKDTRSRIQTLEKEQLGALNNRDKSEGESLALLLYSNEVQESLRYSNTLNELLSSKRLEQQDYKEKIKQNEQRIQQINTIIKNLTERKGRMDYAKLIKEPTSSLNPVSPNKKINILLAGILGLMLFTILAFFLNYIENQKTMEAKNSR